MPLPPPDYLSFQEAANFVAERCNVQLETSAKRLIRAFRDGELRPTGCFGSVTASRDIIPMKDWIGCRLLGTLDGVHFRIPEDQRNPIEPREWGPRWVDIRIARAHLDEWLEGSQADLVKTSTKASPKNGGRKPKWNWHGAVLEAAAYIHENGIPEPRSVLVEHLSKWLFEDLGDPHAVPDRSDIYKRIVTPLCDRLQDQK